MPRQQRRRGPVLQGSLLVVVVVVLLLLLRPLEACRIEDVGPMARVLGQLPWLWMMQWRRQRGTCDGILR